MLEHPDTSSPAPFTPPMAPPPVPAAPRRSGANSPILLVIAGLVFVGGLAFAGGRLTAPAATPTASRFSNFSGQTGATASFAPGAERGLFGGGAGTDLSVQGTVEAISGTTLTLKTASGSTETIDLAATTTYHQQAAASASAITTGSQVQVAIQTAGLGGGPTASGAPVAGGSDTSGTATRALTASDVTLLTP